MFRKRPDRVEQPQFSRPSGSLSRNRSQCVFIYGDNVGPDEQVETNHEGDFVFPWLRPGDYTVYVYSEDTSTTVPPRDMVVVQTVTISASKETVVLDTLRIFKEL